jgi:Ran GTPase-activating protein (RanGAP) involved in mRNA processing and transport
MSRTALNTYILKRIRDNTLGPNALENVDFSNSGVGVNELAVISKCILDNIKKNGENLMSPLCAINLEGNALCGLSAFEDGNFDCAKFQELADIFATYSKSFKIHSLNFARNHLESNGFEIVAEVVDSLKASLTDLNVSDCSGDAAGIATLMKRIEKNKTLLKLDLQRNSFFTDGSRLIASALAVNKKLVWLNLDYCNLTSEGLTFLCDALKVNKSLEVLSVAGNQFGGNEELLGFSKLGDLFEINSTLRNVNLQDNQLTNTAASEISRGLARNNSIECLALQFNEIDNDGAECLGKGLQQNHKLKAIFVEYNHIDNRGAQALLAHNSIVQIDVPY